MSERSASLRLRDAAAEAASAATTVLPLEVMDLSSVGARFHAVNRRHVPLPHRNLPLLSLALSWATLHGADEIALGVTADDAAKAKAGAENTGTFSSAFVRDFGTLARGVAGVELTTPLAESTKPQVLERGRAAGVDFALTFSCMRGADGQHCGTCEQCRARRAAFAAAGIAERPGFYSNGGGS